MLKTAKLHGELEIQLSHCVLPNKSMPRRDNQMLRKVFEAT